jgi:hypothetical protein
LSKKKQVVKVDEKVVEKVEEVVDTSPKIYVSYVVKLEEEFGGCAKGKTLDATLMPVIVDRKNDKWENKWFMYDGERFLGLLPRETKIITVVSVKKGKK